MNPVQTEMKWAPPQPSKSGTERWFYVLRQMFVEDEWKIGIMSELDFGPYIRCNPDWCPIWHAKWKDAEAFEGHAKKWLSEYRVTHARGTEWFHLIKAVKDNYPRVLTWRHTPGSVWDASASQERNFWHILRAIICTGGVLSLDCFDLPENAFISREDIFIFRSGDGTRVHRQPTQLRAPTNAGHAYDGIIWSKTSVRPWKSIRCESDWYSNRIEIPLRSINCCGEWAPTEWVAPWMGPDAHCLRNIFVDPDITPLEICQIRGGDNE